MHEEMKRLEGIKARLESFYGFGNYTMRHDWIKVVNDIGNLHAAQQAPSPHQAATVRYYGG